MQKLSRNPGLSRTPPVQKDAKNAAPKMNRAISPPLPPPQIPFKAKGEPGLLKGPRGATQLNLITGMRCCAVRDLASGSNPSSICSISILALVKGEESSCSVPRVLDHSAKILSMRF